MAKKYIVKISRSAELDVKTHFQFILKENKLAAVKWLKEIERQIDTLERFPGRCPIIPEAEDLGLEYRHLIYGNYRTIFRIDGSSVIILRVIHSSQLLDF